MKNKYNPTEAKILKLESQLEAQRHENKILSAQTKVLRKRAAIFEALVEEMGDYVTPVTPLPKLYKAKQTKTTEHLVMHISDIHGDEVVKPSQVGGLEDYDFKICCLRAQNYVEKVLDMSQGNLQGYDFPVLWILSYGDLTSGEIHNGVSRSYYRNQFKNCLAIGRLQAYMIRDLAPYFKEVKVLCLPGNHGRRSTKKDYEGAHDNWDYLVCEISQLLCNNISNVEFAIPDAFSANIKINGHIFNVSHGDDIKSWNSIPYYGIERKTRRITSLHIKDRIRYFVMGHFHQPANISNNMDGETLVNGPWAATNPYAYEGLGVATEPSQWLHGVHEKYGVSWQVKMRLRQTNERKLLETRKYDI